jgi:hypothetical protein
MFLTEGSKVMVRVAIYAEGYGGGYLSDELGPPIVWFGRSPEPNPADLVRPDQGIKINANPKGVSVEQMNLISNRVLKK